MFNYEMYLSGIPDLFLYVFILYGLALESSMREWRIYTIMPDIINIQTIWLEKVMNHDGNKKLTMIVLLLPMPQKLIKCRSTLDIYCLKQKETAQ